MREGYKDTPIGMIPEDWDVMKLAELGATYNGLSGKTKEDFGVGEPFIPYKNIFKNSKIDPEYLDYVQVNPDENQNSVKYGDIFFTTSSETAEEVGMSSVLLTQIQETYLNSFCFGFRLNDFYKLIPEYARYLFRGDETRKILTILAQGYTRYNLSKSIVLEKLLLKIPPVSEQSKIASILSTVDDKIDAINERITKTQKLKNGLMQRLLTRGIGHTKFKDSPLGEIPQSWEVVRINQIGEIITGTTPPTAKREYYKENGEGILWASPADLGYSKYIQKTNKTLTIEGFKQTRKIPPKSILVTCIGSTIGKLGMSNCDMSTNQQINTIVSNSQNDPDFIYYMLQSLIPYLKSLAGTQAVPIMNKTDFGQINIKIPTLIEQKIIAGTLSTIDYKVESMQEKKNGYEKLKTGLMQQLLTGNIRVKV